jgi:hypothetical protein
MPLTGTLTAVRIFDQYPTMPASPAVNVPVFHAAKDISSFHARTLCLSLNVNWLEQPFSTGADSQKLLAVKCVVSLD